MSVVIVLSAPGSAEEGARPGPRPAAGRTGAELQAFVSAGHASQPDIFHSPNLEDYRITNAWDQVEYEKKTGRSEATSRAQQILAGFAERWGEPRRPSPLATGPRRPLKR